MVDGIRGESHHRKQGSDASRSAFTMIELIFAIVIIAVSMLSLPMIMGMDAQSQEDSLAQEGIMLTTTKVSQALTFPWDPASSSEAAGLMSASQVLDTPLPPAGLGRNAADPDFRIGHFPAQLRRRLTPPTLPRAASAIGAGANSISSLDGDTENIGAVGGQFAYKKQWQLVTAVSYVTDAAAYGGTAINFDFDTAAAGGATNIKMVRVTATDTTPGSAGNQVVLTSYSSNIGEAEFYKRRY